ncbi:P-loop containing nucleoside triphosphate hydrolase protein, partial [Panus rudis PR-1116 ss-1]
MAGSPVQQLSKIARRRDQRKPAKKWGPSRTLGLKPSSRLKLTDDDLKKLAESIKTTCGWQTDPREFQLAGIQSQLEGTDTIIQASTGAGKTAIAAGPHFHASSKGKCTIMVEPLIQLQDEMVTTFREEFKLKAVAVNSKTGMLSQPMVNEILSGKHQIILVSPEMLQSRAFINKILRNTSFAHRVLSIFIDEAHCISHWGANFRKKYGTLGIVRAFLPRNVPVMAVTATLTAKVRRDIQSKLHFPRSGSLFLNVGNNRSNVSLVTRACQHAMSSFADIEFVIPAQVASREDIPKTYIYVDNIDEGSKMIDHLNDILRTRNSAVADEGVIRPFNAVLSHEYRSKAMSYFREGTIRVLVCTDAAGMGCNIPDIDIVVQWRLPATLSNWVQRAGRAARGRGRKGLAILLVEPSAYSLDPTSTLNSTTSTETKKGSKNLNKKSAKPTMPNGTQYAMDHGKARGGGSGKDMLPIGAQPILNMERDDEGLLVFVQSTQCRRKVWLEVFENNTSMSDSESIDVRCCDICHPDLLELIRPGTPSAVKEPRMPRKGVPDVAVEERLEEWRKEVFLREYKGSQLDPTALLDDETIELLSSLGPLNSNTKIQHLLKHRWAWWDVHGPELSALLLSLDIVARPKPRKPKGSQ